MNLDEYGKCKIENCYQAEVHHFAISNIDYGSCKICKDGYSPSPLVFVYHEDGYISHATGGQCKKCFDDEFPKLFNDCISCEIEK